MSARDVSYSRSPWAPGFKCVCLVSDRKVPHNVVQKARRSSQRKFGCFDNDEKSKRSRREHQVKVRAKPDILLPKTIPKLTAS